MFAKLYEHDTLGQILIQKTPDPEQRPSIAITIEVNDILITAFSVFETYEASDKVFNQMSKSQAFINADILVEMASNRATEHYEIH